MGHFKINLPDGRQGDVRFGTVTKESLSLNFFSKNKSKSGSKTGYVVKVSSEESVQEEYWLYQSKDGKWSQDVEGEKELDLEIHHHLKNAIAEMVLKARH